MENNRQEKDGRERVGDVWREQYGWVENISTRAAEQTIDSQTYTGFLQASNTSTIKKGKKLLAEVFDFYVWLDDIDYPDLSSISLLVDGSHILLLLLLPLSSPNNIQFIAHSGDFYQLRLKQIGHIFFSLLLLSNVVIVVGIVIEMMIQCF